ncbi:ArnT family glycosyltransferase [Haloarcula litorea]|uniref:ArnT family glycosyltransferase n=1 Tax=Haloarcula litorea TaxID=3032579 RepID=UPI0023E8928E|nr:glycosyltransferase family 39 protein [Halomicroarcula sp. GDY20]
MSTGRFTGLDRVRAVVDVPPVALAEYAAAFAFLAAGLPLVYVGTPLQLDEALFLVLGEQLQQGGRLYAGFADHKPPGMPWLAAGLVQLGGEPHVWGRLLTYAVNATCALVLIGVGRRLYSLRAGAFASLLYLGSVYLPHFQGHHFTSEVYANLCLVVGALFLLRGHSPDRFVGGACLAVAALFNQTVLLVGLPVGVYLFLDWARDAAGGRRRLVRRYLVVGTGFGLPLVAAGGVLAVRGALVDALHYTVYYPATGYGTPLDPLGQLRGVLSYLPVLLLVAVELAVLGRRLRRQRSVDPAAAFVVLWLLVLSAPGLTTFSGTDRLLFAFPPATLLAGVALTRVHDELFPLCETVGLRGLFEGVSARECRQIERAAAVVVVAVLLVSVGTNAVLLSRQVGESMATQEATAERIGDRIEGEAYLLGYDNAIYYFSDPVEPAPTFVGYPYSTALAESITADLERHEVEYVVVPRRWTDDGHVERGGLWPEQRAPIFEYVERNYEHQSHTEEYAVYRRSDGAASSE